MKTNQRQAFEWWDKLNINQKVWYGQMFPYKNANELIYRAYQEHLVNTKSHLRIVEQEYIMKFDTFTSTKGYGHVAFNRAKEGTTRAAIFFIIALIIVGSV